MIFVREKGSKYLKIEAWLELPKLLESKKLDYNLIILQESKTILQMFGTHLPRILKTTYYGLYEFLIMYVYC